MSLGLTVTDLNGNTDYALTVHAETNAGPGQASGMEQFMTPPGPRKESPIL